jgi:hypothetical protein
MKKPKLTGQKKMAEKIYTQSKILLRELNAVKAGFQKYVLREDILYFIEKIAKKTVKIIELENYERDIPDDVVDKLVEAKPYFDEFFIVFTDYTGESERTIEKEKRDKDPIMFGCIHHPDKDRVPTNRMYFIADWVDEYCDLTLEDMCIQYKSKMKDSILHIHEIPETLEELKKTFEKQETESKINTIETIQNTRGLTDSKISKNDGDKKGTKKKSTREKKLSKKKSE